VKHVRVDNKKIEKYKSRLKELEEETSQRERQYRAELERAAQEVHDGHAEIHDRDVKIRRLEDALDNARRQSSPPPRSVRSYSG